MIMKKSLLASAVFCCMVALLGAQTPTGHDIMAKADKAEEGKTSTYVAAMTLTNSKGNVRVREVIFYKKDYGTVKKSVVAFRTPKDVAGVGYLMWDYPEVNGVKKDSDSWLYMPALKKVRRISGSDSGGDFMGTDFTYDDMGDRGLEKDTYTLLGEESADGIDCWKIECRAKKSDEKNPRRIVWIRKDCYLTEKAEYYDRQDKLQRTLACSDIRQVEGIWTTGKMLMKNMNTNHTTEIAMNDVHYNQPLNDSLFTVASLERGAVK
jgi:hypothetical protein